MGAQSRSEETTEAIMRATYRALCEHGYPDTSISKIAEEFDKSRGLLYYHYEDKDDLLTDFLRYLLERLDTDVVEETDDDPYDQLVALVDRGLPEQLDDEDLRFRRAFFEIRSQAPHSTAYRDLIEQNDDLLRSKLANAIDRGIEAGDFRAVDADRTADFILSAMYGGMERGATLEDRDLIRRNRDELLSYVDRHLLEESSERES